MPTNSYFQLCPIAMAAEILEPRWTMLILRNLCFGASRFNEIRRGMPRMSPTLLAKRLRELEDHGIIIRSPIKQNSDVMGYKLTSVGKDLSKLLLDLGSWNTRHFDVLQGYTNTDITLFMRDIERCLIPEQFPLDSGVVQIELTDIQGEQRNWWIMFTAQERPEVGQFEPPQDVNLYIATNQRTLAAVWIGNESFTQAKNDHNMKILGPESLVNSLPKWLGKSGFVQVDQLNQSA